MGHNHNLSMNMHMNSNKENQNLDGSSIMMKSSIKSNVSMNMNMKSSVLTTRGSMANLMNMSGCGNGNGKSLKTQPDDRD